VQQRPARRVIVQALEVVNGVDSSVLVSTATNDLGEYQLTIPAGAQVKVRAISHMTANAYVKDGIGPENCSGASWDVRVVDNTTYSPTTFVPYSYALTSTATYSAAATVNFTPSYTDRAAAPFALLDTILREIELVCSAKADQAFPLLLVNWSVNNVPDGDGSIADKRLGRIITSHYLREGFTDSSTAPRYPKLYIVGKADVDTDEYEVRTLWARCSTLGCLSVRVMAMRCLP
ncbi:hypothetical protein EBZ37_10340, partial [bacterium]|nr:hypothetical protein [bacterium]